MSAADHHERRQRLRYADGATQVLLRGQGLFGRLKAESRELLDFNRDGLAFAHDEELDPGVVLALEVDAGELHVTGIPALVRDCRPRAEGYRVGVAFAPDRLRGSASERLREALHKLENLLKRRL